MSQGGHASPDPELTAVRRAFNAAFQRMREANDTGELQDELSNMLHHMYRLGELCKRRWQINDKGLTKKIKHISGALGALWIRCYDTHQLATTAKVENIYASFYPKKYGLLVWETVNAMPFIQKPKDVDRYTDYEWLQNRPVLDTLRAAFDGLAAML